MKPSVRRLTASENQHEIVPVGYSNHVSVHRSSVRNIVHFNALRSVRPSVCPVETCNLNIGYVESSYSVREFTWKIQPTMP